MEASLVLIGKNGKHKTFDIPSEVTVLGRKKGCDLRIPLPVISRKHAQIEFEDGKYTVRDLNSRNGTALNGEILSEETPLNPGDVIGIGPLAFMIRIDGKPEQVLQDFESLSTEKSQQAAESVNQSDNYQQQVDEYEGASDETHEIEHSGILGEEQGDEFFDNIFDDVDKLDKDTG